MNTADKEILAIFRDIYPTGMVGLDDSAALKIVHDAFTSAKKKHSEDISKAAFMAEKIVRSIKKSIVLNAHAEAA